MLALRPDEHTEEQLIERFLLLRVRDPERRQDGGLSRITGEDPSRFSTVLAQALGERQAQKPSPPRLE